MNRSGTRCCRRVGKTNPSVLVGLPRSSLPEQQLNIDGLASEDGTLTGPSTRPLRRFKRRHEIVRQSDQEIPWTARRARHGIVHFPRDPKCVNHNDCEQLENALNILEGSAQTHRAGPRSCWPRVCTCDARFRYAGLDGERRSRRRRGDRHHTADRVHGNADVHRRHSVPDAEVSVWLERLVVVILRWWRHRHAHNRHHARLLVVREQQRRLGLSGDAEWSGWRVGFVHGVREYRPASADGEFGGRRTKRSTEPAGRPVSIFAEQQQ